MDSHAVTSSHSRRQIWHVYFVFILVTKGSTLAKEDGKDTHGKCLTFIWALSSCCRDNGARLEGEKWKNAIVHWSTKKSQVLMCGVGLPSFLSVFSESLSRQQLSFDFVFHFICSARSHCGFTGLQQHLNKIILNRCADQPAVEPPPQSCNIYKHIHTLTMFTTCSAAHHQQSRKVKPEHAPILHWVMLLSMLLRFWTIN